MRICGMKVYKVWREISLHRCNKIGIAKYVFSRITSMEMMHLVIQ
jgi:hypothetical protein